ncbi:MAG TPA: sensor histidine kinase [Gemmatimonadaceae bacterium]|nr:sensor histidine kinase [Gemmatimonadaceae bacterium]
MRLPDFIRAKVEAILVEWESFARSLPLGGSMDIQALRDHAKEMLAVIADDLDQPQTSSQQVDKAQGLSDAGSRATLTAAQRHGAGRAESGFSVEAMVAEFRALRASVTRLWMERREQANASDLQELIRFNEAIDQAIAESITTYTKEVAQSKQRFLAILGHDLRTPIGAIMTSTRFMLDAAELSEPWLTLVANMASTARRMNRLVSDLLEFTRSRFGDSIPINAAPMDAVRMVEDVAAEIRASYQGTTVNVEWEGDTRGTWDCERVTQAVVNLVGNAVHHGTRGTPIGIVVRGRPHEVTISVRNEGQAIPATDMRRIFDGMKQLGVPSGKDRRHLGLGLYIVDKIARAHGGSIDVESGQHVTVFTLHLPRV